MLSTSLRRIVNSSRRSGRLRSSGASARAPPGRYRWLDERALAFRVSVPSWGVGTGGTRFARFPGPGEPRNVFEKVEDCEVVFKLTRSTPGISLHIPWDKPDSAAELRSFAQARGLYIDSMNSNTFQDQAGQPLSYKFGSLSHTDPVRRQYPARPRSAEAGRNGAARTPCGSATAATPDRFTRTAARSLPRQPAPDLPGAARRFPALHRAPNSDPPSAPVLNDWESATTARASSESGPARSWTSGTTRRTSTSR